MTVRRTATVGVVLAGLVLAALAARSYRPFSSDGAGERAPSTTFVDSAFTVALVLAAVGVLVAIAARLWTLRVAKGRGEDRGLRQLVVFLVLFLIVVGVGRWQIERWRRAPAEPAGEFAFPAPPRPSGRSSQQSGAARARSPRVVWPIVTGVGGLVALTVIAAVLLARRGRKRDRFSEEALAELRLALDEAIEDLRRDPDPRRAVVAAYARMEQALAVYGIPRRAAEAPYEYLARVAGELQAERSAAALTDLFEQAKFSDHAVDETMRDRAIAALSTVRDEVRAGA